MDGTTIAAAVMMALVNFLEFRTFIIAPLSTGVFPLALNIADQAEHLLTAAQPSLSDVAYLPGDIK